MLSKSVQVPTRHPVTIEHTAPDLLKLDDGIKFTSQGLNDVRMTSNM
jgi:hypothetical protein